jgi:hypothetical protein
MKYLKHKTSVKVKVGPFMDKDDAVTAETGIVLTGTGAQDLAELWKHDAASATDISGRTWAHLAGGWYNLTLTTGDTNTCGQLDIAIQDPDTCLPVFKEYTVLRANVYDSLIGAGTGTGITDTLDVNIEQVAGQTVDVVTGTVGTGSTTTNITTNLTQTQNDAYNGRTIYFEGNTTSDLGGQAASIQDYNGSTKAITLASGDITDAPGSGEKFRIA